jgi:alpha-L-fucosidase 2
MQDYREDSVEYLPCLPEEWQSGEVKGFITRTGEKVSFSWENGKIIKKEVTKNALAK